MTEQQQTTTIEIENEDEQPEQPKSVDKPKSNRLNIQRKKVSELSEEEKQQLILDAQNGFDNQFYSVKLFKNGKCKIGLKKQSKSQQIINDANEYQPPTNSQRPYYTDNQLLFEHIINLETSLNTLRTKHKKLKKRYNALEGYLYNDDEADDDDNEEQPTPKQIPQQQSQEQPEEQLQQQQIPQQTPNIQYRYVKSWRDLQRQ